MNLATPAIFIVAAKASFQRNQSNLSRGSVATIDFQPFLSAEPDFRAHTEQPLTQSRSANKKDAAWLDFSDYVAPDADMAQRAARLSASVHRYIEFLDHAERSNIILSDSARQKLESAISEFE